MHLTLSLSAAQDGPRNKRRRQIFNGRRLSSRSNNSPRRCARPALPIETPLIGRMTRSGLTSVSVRTGKGLVSKNKRARDPGARPGREFFLWYARRNAYRNAKGNAFGNAPYPFPSPIPNASSGRARPCLPGPNLKTFQQGKNLLNRCRRHHPTPMEPVDQTMLLILKDKNAIYACKNGQFVD